MKVAQTGDSAWGASSIFFSFLGEILHAEKRRSMCSYKSPERRREYCRQWRKAHPDYWRKWHEARPGGKSAYNRQWNEANKVTKAQCSRNWREAHKEEIAEYNRQYLLEHPDKMRGLKRKWYEAHKEEVAECGRQYRLEHCEEIKGRQRRWRRENPEKRREYGRQHRARKRNAYVEDIDETFIYECNRYACVYCSNPFNLSLDHVTPLVNGGKHSYNNLVVACRSCNSSKGTQEVFQWLALGKHRDRRTTNGNRINI